MTAFRTLLIAIVLIVCETPSYSQIDSTMNLPVSSVRRRLIEAKQSKVLLRQIDTLHARIDELSEAIVRQQQALNVAISIRNSDSQTQELLRQNNKSLEEQKKYLQSEISALNKKVNFANIKTTAVGVIGTILLYLALKR